MFIFRVIFSSIVCMNVCVCNIHNRVLGMCAWLVFIPCTIKQLSSLSQGPSKVILYNHFRPVLFIGVILILSILSKW